MSGTIMMMMRDEEGQKGARRVARHLRSEADGFDHGHGSAFVGTRCRMYQIWLHQGLLAWPLFMDLHGRLQ